MDNSRNADICKKKIAREIDFLQAEWAKLHRLDQNGIAITRSYWDAVDAAITAINTGEFGPDHPTWAAWMNEKPFRG